MLFLILLAVTAMTSFKLGALSMLVNVLSVALATALALLGAAIVALLLRGAPSR